MDTIIYKFINSLHVPVEEMQCVDDLFDFQDLPVLPCPVPQELPAARCARKEFSTMKRNPIWEVHGTKHASNAVSEITILNGVVSLVLLKCNVQ